MREQIEAAASRGAPSLSGLIEHDGQIIWPMQGVQALVHNATPGAVAFPAVPDTVAMFAWLYGPAMIKKIDSEIDSEADDQNALSHAEREKREAEVSADLLDIERQEAALTFKAWAEGLQLDPRADLDPVAVLNVVLVVAPAVNPSPGAKGMSWAR